VEIDSQILNAIEKWPDRVEDGHVLELLVRHPAGLLGKGSEPWHGLLDRGIRDRPGSVMAAAVEDKALARSFTLAKMDEEDHIRARVAEIWAAWKEGKEDKELTDEIANEKKKQKAEQNAVRLGVLEAIQERGEKAKRKEIDIGPFPRARKVKDHLQFRHQERGLANGWKRIATSEELLQEHEQQLVNTVDAINLRRGQLGLGRMKLVDEE